MFSILKEFRKKRILKQLEEIDLKSARASRSIALASAKGIEVKEEDIEILLKYENKAKELRDKLHEFD